MNVIFARKTIPENLTNSIMLCGPTPRDAETKSWRPDALELFNKYKFNGTILVPEDKDWGVKGDYYDQIEWEEQGLKTADCILFWIPRKLDTMPGLTTNDEWGYYKASGKVVLGVPDEAEKCRYQIYYANKFKIPFAKTLEDTVLNSMKLLYIIEENRLKAICNSYI